MKSYKPTFAEQRKKVFKNAEIEHVWAQQTVTEGRNPQGNVFFEGVSLFSYGHHFETARFVAPGVVLITTKRYSVTTSGHVHAARMAVSHLKTFNVESFDDAKVSATAYITDLTADLEKISRMRSDAKWDLERYREKCNEAAEYVTYYKPQVGAKLYKQVLALQAKCDNPLTGDVLETFKKKQAAARVKAKSDRIAKAQALAVELADAVLRLAAWKDGLPTSQYNFDRLPVALRVVTDEEGHSVIETTKGASVPVIEARKLWRTLRTDAGAVPGMRIGHYTVTRIDPEGGNLIIGCHTIPMREMGRMAVKLGLEKEAA